MEGIVRVLIHGPSLPKKVFYGPGKGHDVNHTDRKTIQVKGNDVDLRIMIGDIIITADISKFNDLMNSQLIEENALISNAIEEIVDLLGSSTDSLAFKYLGLFILYFSKIFSIKYFTIYFLFILEAKWSGVLPLFEKEFILAFLSTKILTDSKSPFCAA